MDKERGIRYVLYLYIHSRIYNLTNGSHIMRLKEAIGFLHEWRIPKKLRPVVIRELQLMNLIERVDRWNVSIKRPEIDLDKQEEYFNILKGVGIVKK